jgi:NAD(P)-dependent dehydrogenase (short-subunit alcohol dehydrogenase family)
MTQTVLVTGASSRIGKATALLLKRDGFTVFGTTRRPDAVGPQEFLHIQGGTKGSN